MALNWEKEAHLEYDGDMNLWRDKKLIAWLQPIDRLKRDAEGIWEVRFSRASRDKSVLHGKKIKGLAKAQTMLMLVMGGRG